MDLRGAGQEVLRVKQISPAVAAAYEWAGLEEAHLRDVYDQAGVHGGVPCAVLQERLPRGTDGIREPVLDVAAVHEPRKRPERTATHKSIEFLL